MNTQKWIALLFLLMLSLVTSGCEVSNTGEGASRRFIRAVADRNEQQAMANLSVAAQAAVTQYCEDAKVVACFDAAGMQSWGQLTDILFVQGDADGAIAFSTIWSNKIAIRIVFEPVEENGRWVIDGWRGLLRAEGPYPGGLLEGTDRTNAFPPDP